MENKRIQNIKEQEITLNKMSDLCSQLELLIAN